MMLETNVKLVNIIYHVSSFMFNIQKSLDIDNIFKTFKDIIMKDILMYISIVYYC